MAKDRDVVETLVQQTVHEILFLEPSDESSGHRHAVFLRSQYSSKAAALEAKAATREGATTSLLHLLLTQTSSSNCSSEGDKESEEDPAQDEDEDVAASARFAWVLECPKWSLDRLRENKLAIKKYIQRQHENQQHSSDARPRSTELSAVHEAYALLKLFLMERDVDYRRHLQHAASSTTAFTTSLHVLLTLYATYFQRAHGRQVCR
ncbi:hypothetical protein BBJ28_00001201 [Nothophytophthora sp. Chile5]|nr:hypothetical protein BBJ28_00001201 [Nothophytophthora sp. Chile5]